MPSKKKIGNERNCEICLRSTRDARVLGQLIETKGIAAHVNCIVFSPVKPEKEDLADDGIGGVSARFIRSEAKRAKPLVSSFAWICILDCNHL